MTSLPTSKEETKETDTSNSSSKSSKTNKKINNIFNDLKKFDKSSMKPTTTTVRHIICVNGDQRGTGLDSAIKNEEEIKEYFDTEEELKKKAKDFANLLKTSSHVVFYTGAGISTSAKVPDYRGPTGVWTLRAKGYEPKFKITLEQAIPTYTHMAIVKLFEKGLLKYLVSTNVDGLHRRSGVTQKQMSELHGNIYKENCHTCGKEHLRPFDTTKLKHEKEVYDGHRTGRLCQKKNCNGKLYDSIINFGENLPSSELNPAIKHSEKADFVVALGTSMRVRPACDLPSYSYNNGGKFVIINLQKTPYDDDCYNNGFRVFSKLDQFFKLVMEDNLKLKVEQFKVDKFMEEIKSEMKQIKLDPTFRKYNIISNTNKIKQNNKSKE